jgi:hypothetical protein
VAVPPFRPPVPEPLHGPDWVRPAGNLDFRVTQGFYDVNPDFPVQHRALDLGNTRLGAPITAPASGRIVGEGYLREPWSESSDRFGTGNFGGIMAVIDHGNEWISALAHLADTVVSAGQIVTAGQLIGHLGQTGSAAGQGHLHWDLYRGRPTSAMSYAQRSALKVDPWPLLAQNYDLPDSATEDDPLDWSRDIRPVKPFRFRVANTVNVYDRPELSGLFATKQLKAGESRIAIGAVKGPEYPPGSGNTTWDAWATGNGWRCIPSATHGEVTQLSSDSGISQAELDAAVAEARADGIVDAAAAAAAVK